MLCALIFYKDERPTSNIERPISNENKSPIPNNFFFFIFLNSKFDVGRWMFDVHSFSSIKAIWISLSGNQDMILTGAIIRRDVWGFGLHHTFKSKESQGENTRRDQSDGGVLKRPGNPGQQDTFTNTRKEDQCQTKADSVAE